MTASDTPVRLTAAALNALSVLEQAAKGAPWSLVFDNQDVRLVSLDDPEIANWTFLVRPWIPGDWDDCDLSDQRLIVALRNHAPQLIALAREAVALREAVENILPVNDYCCGFCDGAWDDMRKLFSHADDCAWLALRVALRAGDEGEGM